MTSKNMMVPEAMPGIAAAMPYPPPRSGAASIRKKHYSSIELGGGRANGWVESMKASSPTHAKAAAALAAAPADELENPEHSAWIIQHPSALSKFEQIMNATKGKQIVMFLDYDGTLSPIVDDPDSAFMSEAMRAAVKEVARCFPTAIVSGRCRSKVYDFVKLTELYYAGSHGMDIKVPKGTKYTKKKDVILQPASEFLPAMNEVHKKILEKTKPIPGAKVENNKFCVSVHFRCVEEKVSKVILNSYTWHSMQVNSNNSVFSFVVHVLLGKFFMQHWGLLVEQVCLVLKEYPKLRITQGRKVLEIRPTIKWDKGKALEFLLESLGFADCKNVVPVYIGDDRTDEDAFKVLCERGQGIGILVSEFPKETKASYCLREPSEVMDFLLRLVEWKRVSGAK